jgi:predicted Kef-type K+ transport protein
MFEIWSIDAIWISVAFLFGVLAKKINLPPLIGYLAGGFFLNFMGIAQGGAALHVISDVGIMLLLFTIGLKLDVKSLLSRDVWLSAGLHMVLSILAFSTLVLVLSYLGLSGIGGLSIGSALIIGFALSFSSTVFAVKILEGRGEITSFHGNLSIGILIFQDIVAVVYLTLSKGTLPNLWALGLPLYLWLIRYVLVWFLKLLDQNELLTLFGFLAAFVAGAFVFEFSGIKPDLGALVIGILLGSHPRSNILAKHMLGFKDFFLIAFFLNIGLSGLPNLNMFVIALLFAFAIPLKGGLFMLILTRLNLRARTAWLVTLSLSNYSEFGLIIAAIGFKSGMLDEKWLIIIALALSLSFLFTSPLNTHAHKLFQQFSHILMRLNTKTNHPDDQPLDLGDAKVVICGMGHVGRAAYHQLTKDFSDKVIAIDYNRTVVKTLSKTNKNIVWGDTTDFNFWRNVNMPDVELIMVTMHDFASNNNTALALQKCSSTKIKISAPGYTPEEHSSLKESGVDYVYNYYSRAGSEFATGFLNFLENRENDKKTS